ncbi:MAG TPA: type IV pilus modification protein PilV [Deltaproteobacteria bacterium]|nr:type IV pilus modification protein PilV [Deltaproteobacteria bacterium]
MLGKVSRAADERGFTLLEVLVSMVVISVGLLAAASMQATAMSGTRSSNDMSVAIQLAEEMVDRIRVNGGMTPDDYDGIDTSSGCSGSDPALGDCTQWYSRLADSGLTGAAGTVSVSTDSPISKVSTVTVTITWGAVTSRSVSVTTLVESIVS